MKEISNKTIMLLLVLSVSLTILTTVISISKLYGLSEVFTIFTGAPSFSFGETNVTITSNTALSLIGGNGTVISFGSGFVNASCNFCQMDSNGINVSGYANGSNLTVGSPSVVNCCTTFTVPSSGFLLENTGNVNLSVGYTCSGNCTFATFIGGTRGELTKVGNGGGSGFELKVTQNSVASQGGEEGGTDTAASCRGGGTLYRDSGWNITNASSFTPCPGTSTNFSTGNCTGIPSQTYTSISSIGHYLCGNSSSYPLMADNTQDAAVVDINITIPYDGGIGGGRSSFRLTFNGTSSG